MEHTDKVVIVCSDRTETYYNRSKAIERYLELLDNSKGEDRRRYMNIFIDLKSGKRICKER